MSEPDVAAWTRQQIEADLAAARIIGAGGFAPQRWDTEPAGQVNPDDISATDRINAALIPDSEDRQFREHLPGWVEIVSYDRLNNEPPEADCRDDDLPVALVANCRREFEHIIRHDPRNVVADCEAKLAILGICEQIVNDVRTFSILEQERAEDAQRIILFLAAGYCHRPGYQEAWKPDKQG